MNRELVVLIVMVGILLSIVSCGKTNDLTSSTGIEMVYVQGGTFQMGSNDGRYNEKPVHQVTISDFYIGKHEVTQKQYQSVMGKNPSDYKGDNLPVETVSWFDAIEYCNKLSFKEGLTPVYSYGDSGANPYDWPSGWKINSDNIVNVSCNWNANGYRLPTEAEWEFAARGGLPAQQAGTFNDRWAGTDVEAELINYAWYAREDNEPQRRLNFRPMGKKQPNEMGIYDMSGNDWEWCWDVYDSYPSDSFNHPKGTNSGGDRVLRGGSWLSIAYSCRVNYRSNSIATMHDRTYGFRVSRTLD